MNTTTKILTSNGDILLDIDSSTVRLALRAYFTVAFFSLALIGNALSETRARRTLVNHRSVPVTYLTDWMSGPAAVWLFIQQKQFPCGWIGVVMVATWLLSLASDLMVSGLVKSVQVPGRCTFGKGVVIPPKPATLWHSIPSNQQRAYRIVVQAQLTSVENGGLGGIFAKANADPRFRGERVDVLGSWSCTVVDVDPVMFPPETSATTILSAHKASGLLYNQSAGACWGTYADGGSADFFLWSASVENRAMQPWDARFAVDTSTKGPHGERKIMTFQCTMRAPKVAWVISQIDVSSAFEQWCFGIKNDLIDSDARFSSPASISTFEQTLNSMVMVGWGGGVSFSDRSTSTQGCLTERARMPWPVYTLAAIVSIGLLAMILITLALLLGVKGRSIRAIPFGLAGWMAWAIAEHTRFGDVAVVEKKQLRLWKFGYHNGGGVPGYGIYLDS